MMKLTDDQIARVVHEANRALQFIFGDNNPSQPWDAELPMIKRRTVRAVRLIREGMTAPEIHADWLRWRHDLGWVKGDTKDYEKLTHPAMRDWENLDERQQVKTEIMVDIVNRLKDEPA